MQKPAGKQTGVPATLFDQMVEVRRDLHKHPELSFDEERTAKRIASELDRLGLEYKTGVGGHGIVADIQGLEDGPLVAVRADMDALPIQEETGLPFSSIHDGVMHACGHDGHTSMLLGAASLLSQGPPPPRGVRLLWQPAEERGDGANQMIKDGVLDSVAMIFGGHIDRHYPAGVLAVTEGVVNASSDRFDIHIRGAGGHGARPHEAVDAIVVGSLLVTAIQTIVSREVDPAHPSVLTVGTFQAGSASNVIAERATLSGTIRAQHPAVREHLHNAISRIAQAIGQLHDAHVDVSLTEGTPLVTNSPDMTTVARIAAERIVGERQVVALHTANMGGEDFGAFLEHVPGAYIRFGAQVPGREGFPAHSSRFDFDEEALAIGAAWMAEVAREAGAQMQSEDS